MGINLGSLVSSTPISFNYLSGKKLAVDGNNTLYQFLSSIRQPDGTPLMDSNGRVTGHLTGLFYRCTKWLEEGLRPVFVFDGKPPKLKEKTLDGRRERKKLAYGKWQKALSEGREEDAHMFAQATSKLSSEMVGQAQELLSLMGIPVVNAPSEGEAAAAFLASSSKVWACASQDYDSLLFGAPRLVRNLSTTGRRKIPRKGYIDISPELLELGKILASNSLTREQLVWLAVLVGTDFNEGVKGVGPKTALKLVSGAKSWEEALSRLSQTRHEATGLEHAKEAIEFFLNPPKLGEVSIEFGKPDKEGVIKFLCDGFDFSQDRAERTLEKLEKTLSEKGAQTTLGNW